MRARVASALVIALLVGGAVLAGRQLRVETDITHFLPSTSDPRLVEIARALTSSEQTRMIVLTLAAPDEDTAARAAGLLGERLGSRDDVAWARTGSDETLQRAFYEVYYPRRLGLAIADPSDAPRYLGADGMRARAESLRERLALPTSPFVREIADEDPWLVFPELLDRLRDDMRGDLRVHDGRFVTSDGRHGVVLLASRRSAFDTDASERLLAGIDRDFQAVCRQVSPDLHLEWSAVHRYAVRAAASTRADISRVSIAGSVFVLLFLVGLFPSVRLVVLGNVPLVVGFAASVIAVGLLLDSVHGLTLAFGSTLIGVGIDYVAHYLTHHVLAPASDGALGTMRRIWPGLLLGGGTTILGVAALALTFYPAIQEMALFTSVGVAAALLATRYLVPPFMPDRPAPPARLLRALSASGERVLSTLARRRALLFVAPIAAIACIVGGALRLDFVDDVRALSPIDPTLAAEDQRVRARVARVDGSRLVVALGDDVDEALEQNDRVHAALDRARQNGALGGMRSLHALLPSPETQRATHDALVANDAWGRTVVAYTEAGFVPEALEPFREALAAPFVPLRMDDVEGTPIEPFVDPFVLRVGERVAILTFLRDLHDQRAVRRALEPLGDDVFLFDQAAYMAAGYHAFRTRTSELVSLGLVAIFLLILARYRRVSLTLAAFLPAVLAGGAALGAISLLGFPLTFVHVVTVLLVLSMGEDYGIFMVESRDDPQKGPTAASLLVACITTVVSFGALAWSDNPALRAMGMTAAIGVFMSLLLAPTALLFTRVRR